MNHGPRQRPDQQAHPTITGVVRLDLTRLAPSRRRTEAAALRHTPHGSRVQLTVGDLTPWATTYDVVHFVAESAVAAALQVEVQGDPRVVAQWVDELRAALAARAAEAHAAAGPGTPPRRRLHVVPGGAA